MPGSLPRETSLRHPTSSFSLILGCGQDGRVSVTSRQRSSSLCRGTRRRVDFDSEFEEGVLEDARPPAVGEGTRRTRMGRGAAVGTGRLGERGGPACRKRADPDHLPGPEVRNDRGERLDESVDLLERAIELDPHNGAYLDSLGWAYFKLDRLDRAESLLQRAREQMAWNSVIQDHFGDLMLRLGRYADAIAAWESALAGDGDDIERSIIERKIGDARRRLAR